MTLLVMKGFPGEVVVSNPNTKDGAFFPLSALDFFSMEGCLQTFGSMHLFEKKALVFFKLGL